MGTLEKLRSRKSFVRAAVYARFSSDNQRDESIDAQIRAIREYANKNEISIVVEYVDRAKSATTDNRPEFLRMIQDAKENLFDVVLVHKLDRFARNRQDSIGYRMELKRHGVSLVSILEYLDEESPESVILESVLEAMAEYYSRNLAREVQKGMKENALKCNHTGGIPPLGYDVNPETKKLIINEKEAEIVKLIFKLFMEGKGYRQIINELNTQAYTTKCGKPFVKNSLHSILKNEKYKGTYIFNKVAGKNVDGKRNNNKFKDDEDIIRIDGGVPAIIGNEEFESVQRKMQSRIKRRAGNTAKEIYLLSGKIICGECNSSYVGNRKNAGRSKRPHITYRCNVRDRSANKNCMNKEVRREYIEAYVLESLSEYVFSDTLIPLIVQEYNNYHLQQNSEYIQLQERLQKRMKETIKEMNNIISVIGKTASNALVERLNDLEIQKAELEVELNQIKNNIKISDTTPEDIKSAFRKARMLIAEGNASSY